MPRRHIVPTDLLTRRDRYPHSVAAFDPRMLGGKVTAMLDLTASAQSGGDWTNWVDTLNSNPVAYNSARRPAVAAAANGVPIATFAGAAPDVGAWPLNATNNGTTHWSWGFWAKPASVVATGNRGIVHIWGAVGGADVKKILLYQADTALNFLIYSSEAGGRQLSIAGALAANTWVYIRPDWPSSRTGDDRCRVYINGAQASGTYSALGGTFPVTDLRVATGSGLLANGQDGAANGPWSGSLGPVLYSTSSDLTAGEEAALMNYKRPT